MSTQKQIAANRQNAQKSTGPKTPEGRAAVRLNGVTHGLTAQTVILKGETESDFDSLLASFQAEYGPATPTEETLVIQLAMSTWRLRRLYTMETGYYKLRLKDMAGYADSRNYDDARRLGFIADSSVNCASIAVMGRQESRLERSIYKAVHELDRLRSKRREKVINQTQSTPPVPVRAPDTQQINEIEAPPQLEISGAPQPIVQNPPPPDSRLAGRPTL